MKFFRKFVFSFLLFIFLLHPVLTYGQTDSTSTRTIRKYGKGRIIKKDRTKYLGRQLVFKTDVLTFNDENTGRTVTLPLSEVDYVSKIGNHALEGALVGGGLTLLAGALAVLQAEADPYRTTRENAGVIILGLTAGGTALGGLIGFAHTERESSLPKGKVTCTNQSFSKQHKGKKQEYLCTYYCCRYSILSECTWE